MFQRSIVPSSAGDDATYSSQYRIDGRVVTWEAYKDKLGTFGILVKARNFLVFQARRPLASADIQRIIIVP